MILIPLDTIVLAVCGLMFVEGWREDMLPLGARIVFIAISSLVFYFKFRKWWRG